MTNSFEKLVSVAVCDYAEERLSGTLYNEDEFIFSNEFEKKMSEVSTQTIKIFLKNLQ